MTFKDLLVNPIRNAISSLRRKADDSGLMSKADVEALKEGDKFTYTSKNSGKTYDAEVVARRKVDGRNLIQFRSTKGELLGGAPSVKTVSEDYLLQNSPRKITAKPTSATTQSISKTPTGQTQQKVPLGATQTPTTPVPTQQPTPRPVQDQIPQSQWTDAKLPPVTYTPPQTGAGTVAPTQVQPTHVQPQQVQQPAQPAQQQGNSKGAEWVEDPEHKLSPSEVSEKLDGKQGFKTEKGWSIHDPSKQPQEERPEVAVQPTAPQAQPTVVPTPAEPPKEKKEKEEPIDLATAQPEAIQKAESKIYEFHKPPTDEEKAKLKQEVDGQINDFIQSVLSGNANEATLPEMNRDEKIAFFTALFMAERAKMVGSIKISGRNKQKVAWAKELQSKIVTDLNAKANEYINGATKSIAERKEKPKVFGGSLNEFMRPDAQSPEGTPEAYINERSKVQDGAENYSYNRRDYAQGIGEDALDHTQLQAGVNIRGAIITGIKEVTEDLENTDLSTDLKTLKEKGLSQGISLTIGQKPPSPNAKDSMVVSFPLTANTEQVKEALSKIVKTLDKKNLGSLIEIPTAKQMALNTDNIRIKATNWKDLQDVFKAVEKETAKIGGAKAKIEDNRYGLTESEIVDTLADMKSQMLNNNGTFKLYGEGEEVQAGEDNKLSKFALAAKTLNCKIVDNGNGTFGLQAIEDGNSSAYNNGVSPDDSDETTLSKIKSAEEKDKQVPPPIKEDPNEDLRQYMPAPDRRTREYRNKNKQPKPVAPPKVKPVKPVVAPVVPPPSPQAELDLSGTAPAPTAPLPTVTGTPSYRPSVRPSAELHGALDSIADLNSPEGQTALNNTIADVNSSIESALVTYDDLALAELKAVSEKIKSKTQGMNGLPSVNDYRISSYYAIPKFKGKSELQGKGVLGLFRIESVTADKIPGIQQLVSLKSKGKGEERVNKKFNKIDDGIWIDGKDGEFFSGWYEVEDFDGKSTIFVSEDNKLMFKIDRDDDDKARSFIRHNPYLGGINEKPTVSNLEGVYNPDHFLSDRIPMSYAPDTDNITSMVHQYPSLSMAHADGAPVLSALLGFKHKLIKPMKREHRQTLIDKGFHQAVNEMMGNPSVSKLKSILIDSVDPVSNSPIFNEDQKQLISSIQDEDFMKILSSVRVLRGNEKNAEQKAKAKPDKFRQLITKNIEKYGKETGEPTDLLEYLESRPKGLFKMPDKGDKFYREVMELPANVRRRLVNMHGGTPLDEVAKSFGGGDQLGRNRREEYLGTRGTENFLNDVVNQYSKFMSYSGEAQDAESRHYAELQKAQTKKAETMMRSPKKIKSSDIQNKSLYKIDGKIYVAVNDPDNEHGWTFIGADGKKTEQELFGDKPEIEVEGYIHKDSDAWSVYGDTFADKLEELTPKVQSEEEQEFGYQDQNPDDYDPFNIHSSVKPRRFFNKGRNLSKWE